MSQYSREAFAVVLQLPAGRADRFAVDRHIGLARGTAALLEVARGAGGGDKLGFVLANLALALDDPEIGGRVAMLRGRISPEQRDRSDPEIRSFRFLKILRSSQLHNG